MGRKLDIITFLIFLTFFIPLLGGVFGGLSGEETEILSENEGSGRKIIKINREEEEIAKWRRWRKEIWEKLKRKNVAERIREKEKEIEWYREKKEKLKRKRIKIYKSVSERNKAKVVTEREAAQFQKDVAESEKQIQKDVAEGKTTAQQQNNIAERTETQQQEEVAENENNAAETIKEENMNAEKTTAEIGIAQSDVAEIGILHKKMIFKMEDPRQARERDPELINNRGIDEMNMKKMNNSDVLEQYQLLESDQNKNNVPILKEINKVVRILKRSDKGSNMAKMDTISGRSDQTFNDSLEILKRTDKSTESEQIHHKEPEFTGPSHGHGTLQIVPKGCKMGTKNDDNKWNLDQTNMAMKKGKQLAVSVPDSSNKSKNGANNRKSSDWQWVTHEANTDKDLAEQKVESIWEMSESESIVSLEQSTGPISKENRNKPFGDGPVVRILKREEKIAEFEGDYSTEKSNASEQEERSNSSEQIVDKAFLVNDAIKCSNNRQQRQKLMQRRSIVKLDPIEEEGEEEEEKETGGTC